jgi:hypothetical protein
MRITKQSLTSRWLLASVSGAIVFAILAWSDFRLKSLSGFGTRPASFHRRQYRRPSGLASLYAVRAGFNGG